MDPEGSALVYGLAGTDVLQVNPRSGVVSVQKRIDHEVRAGAEEGCPACCCRGGVKYAGWLWSSMACCGGVKVVPWAVLLGMCVQAVYHLTKTVLCRCKRIVAET